MTAIKRRSNSKKPSQEALFHTENDEQVLRDAEISHHLPWGILQSTSDGILAVNPENQVLFANERFAKMWRIPQELMVQTDDTLLLQSVLDQLSDPEEFLQKVRELYNSTEESFDTLYFKDGRVFSRLSQPLWEGTQLRGRVWSFRDITQQKQAEAELQRRANEFAALCETARDLATQRDLPELLHTIAERARTLLHAAGGGIYLYDTARDNLEMVLALGSSVPVGSRLQKGEGMAGRVAETRQPLIVEDYRTWPGRASQYEGMPFRATLQVPMLYGGELVGVLSVNEIDQAERKFTEADASLLSLFAEYAASAVQTARLLQSTRERVEELSALQATALEITAPHELTNLLRTIVTRAAQLLHAYEGGLYLCNAERQEVRCVVSYNTPQDYTGVILKYGEGAAGLVAQTGEPLIIDDYRTWSGRAGVFGEQKPFERLVSAPMLWQDQVIGVIHVLRREGEKPFTRIDLDLLCLLANHAAIAVANAQQFERLQLELTERKRADAALRDSERRYRMITQNSEDLIWTMNLELRLTYVSPAVERKLGYSVEEFLTSSPGRFLTANSFNDGLQAFGEEVQGARAEPDPNYTRMLELEYRRKDGSTLWVETTFSFIRDPMGRPNAVLGVGRDITERKRTEEALRESQTRLAGMIETAMDAIISLDADQRIILFNPAAERLFGCPAADAIGRCLDRFIPERFRQVHRRHIQNFGVTNQTSRSMGRSSALTCLRADGTEFPAEISISQTEMAGQKIYTAILRDITERRRAEAENLSLAKFPSENPNPVLRIAKDGTVIYGNAASAPVLSAWRCQIAQRLPDEPRQVVSDALHSVKTEEMEIVCNERIYSLLFVPIANEDYVNIYGRDVTERKRAEEKIQQQLRRLSALRDIDLAISSTFDMKTSLVVLLNKVTSQLGVSAAAVLLFDRLTHRLEYIATNGFSSAAILNTVLPLSEGLAGRAARERQMVHIPYLTQTHEQMVHTRLLAEEGFVAYYAMPLVAKGELQGVLEIFHRAEFHPEAQWLGFLEVLAGQAAIAIDNSRLFENLQRSKIELEHRVTERTAELNRTNIELEAANHAKDEFLANVSHELRTPLNSILGMSESLLEQRRDILSDQQQRFLQIIESSGRHLLDLVNDVLDLSKIEAGKFDVYPQPMEVDPLCRSCLTFMRAPAMKKSISLVYKGDDTALKIYADPRRLKQILVNLLTNAVKFTPEHGQVTLQVLTDAARDLVQFSVIDTGIGIEEAELKRLFQPFVQVENRLNRQLEGTGLGLALVQKLTDLHGGSVSLESEVGRGSHFTISLPWGRQLVTQLEPADSGTKKLLRGPTRETTLPAAARPQTRVLLAEDNAANVLTIGEYLKSHGFAVQVAHDGLEAIQMAEATNPEIILMDIQMPAMDGLEATRRLRANPVFASTPIIALTALAMPGDRERCLLAGASEYMSKPVSLNTLKQTIETVLKSRSDP